MSENRTTITIHLYHDGPTAGTLDCWMQEPGGPVTSFDPLQIPAKMKDAMGKAAAAALEKAAKAEAAKLEAEEQVKAAEAKFLAVDGVKVESLRAEIDAKNANIQSLLAASQS